MLSKAPFKPQVDVPRMQAAVIDPGLVEALAEILDVYALYGISRDFERLDETNGLLAPDPSRRLPLDEAIPPRGNPVTAIPSPATGLSSDVLIQRYFDWYIAPADVGNGKSGVAAFLARYPLLVYAMDTVTDHHRKNIRLACQRVTDDWDMIRQAFFSGDTIIKLSEIQTTGNDFHKGGKQVLILNFMLAMSDDPGRVVYKPSSVEIDCRIVGNSAIVNECKPQGYTQRTSLTELINTYNPARQRPEGFTSRTLPTYTVLPYNRDSVADAYGYIEFLDHEPVVKGPFEDGRAIYSKVAGKVAELTAAEVQDSDWVVTDSASEQVFYHQLGGVMAMALAVSLSDLHVQNLIVHGKSPCLIDLEEALKHPMTQVAETYLSGLLNKDFDPEGKVLKVLEWTGGLPRADWVLRIGKPAASRLYRWHGQGVPGTLANLNGGVGTDGERNRTALMRGLIDCVETLADPDCNSDVQSWVNSLDATIVRFVPVGTEAYAKAGRDLFSKCCETAIDPLMMTDVEFGEIAYTEGKTTKYFFPEQVVSRRNEWKARYENRQGSPPLLRAWKAPPFFALEHPDHTWRDYLNCDVPSFYHKVDSAELLNSAGAPVNVNDAVNWQSTHMPSAATSTPLPQGWQSNDGGAYLPENPIDMVVNQLEWLATDCKDAERKRVYLEEATQQMGAAKGVYSGILQTMLTPAKPKPVRAI